MLFAAFHKPICRLLQHHSCHGALSKRNIRHILNVAFSHNSAAKQYIKLRIRLHIRHTEIVKIRINKYFNTKKIG